MRTHRPYSGECRRLGQCSDGEATYAQMIHADEQIIAGSNQHVRVLAVVPFEEDDKSPFVGMLKVEHC